MATPTTATVVSEPLPIFKVAHHYMLYDVNAVTYLRREHNISGVLMGTLPQASQQNVFLGLPLELMPEEARLLVEKNVAYIVDDVAEHKRTFLGNGLGVEERKAYQAALRKQGAGAAQDHAKKLDERKKAGLQKAGKATGDWNDIPDDMFEPSRGRKGKPRRPEPAPTSRQPSTSAPNDPNNSESLFGPPSNGPPVNGPPMKNATSRTPSRGSPAGPEPYGVTPTTSQPPMQTQQPATGASMELPLVPSSYPVYKHLHENGYFMAPGLRFGCQYMAYPGDPLRFHSHFLCNGMGWDEEFDLLDLVGGGRLGTGVKKGFLIGGEEQKAEHDEVKAGDVRAFCIEWGGM